MGRSGRLWGSPEDHGEVLLGRELRVAKFGTRRAKPLILLVFRFRQPGTRISAANSKTYMLWRVSLFLFLGMVLVPNRPLVIYL
jgi:hypothetical protein